MLDTYARGVPLSKYNETKYPIIYLFFDIEHVHFIYSTIYFLKLNQISILKTTGKMCESFVFENTRDNGNFFNLHEKY